MKTLGEQKPSEEIDAVYRKRYPNRRRFQPNQRNNNEIRRETQQKCGRCGRSHKRNECPAYGKQCRRCNKKNHFFSQCKTPLVTPSRSNTKSEIHLVETRDEPTDREYYENEEDQYDEMYIDSTEEVDKETLDRWIVQIEVNNKIIPFKVDTGSDVNIMCYEDFKKLPKRPKLKPAKMKLKAETIQRRKCGSKRSV